MSSEDIIESWLQDPKLQTKNQFQEKHVWTSSQEFALLGFPQMVGLFLLW